MSACLVVTLAGEERLRCSNCGTDLGSTEDPLRDPDCMACLARHLERQQAEDAAAGRPW